VQSLHVTTCFQELLKIIMHTDEKLLERAWCFTHKTQCVRVHRPAASASAIDVKIAGSPCTDFSTMGSRQTLCGPTMCLFLLLLEPWRVQATPVCAKPKCLNPAKPKPRIRQVLQARFEIFVFENVVGFHLQLLHDLLGTELGKLGSQNVS
jgi:site-specific DNA-cytosine methylase